MIQNCTFEIYLEIKRKQTRFRHNFVNIKTRCFLHAREDQKDVIGV